ncbi:MAG: YggS family pyridoxal phosphate-dependent enzyme [Clostridia bacterium]|jgi:pyridoxal phosphate enzyme (YggS family)|nr:YggS family pyridoxal phosphate-dependent enzyme [Clostridia bacterium]
MKEEIKQICKDCGRTDDITLIAVTKTVDTEKINHAVSCGVSNLGENKVQEIMDKYDAVDKNVKWHLIGHLQTNKVKYIIDKVELIHSVDSIKLAEEINKRAEKNNLIKDVLVQINVAEEDTKFGIDLEQAVDFIKSISVFNSIRIKGLMTIAPYDLNPEGVRPIFRQLKDKFDELAQMNLPNTEMKHLSMGMSNDYKVAIEEGANMIRIGTAIFGKRNYNI